MTFWKKLLVFSQFFYKIPFYYENWPMVYGDYGRLVRGKVLYQLRSGEKFWARAGKYDIVTLNEVFISKQYARPETGIKISEGDIVFDVGASIGDFAVQASKLAEKVYSFEPSKEAFSLLKENIKLNGCKNVLAFNFGLGGENGVKTFFVDASRGVISRAKISKVSDFLRMKKISRIDFLKLDCEGAEFEILYSLKRKFLKSVRYIAMEYHEISERKKGHTVRELAGYLRKNGFRVFMDKEMSETYAGHIYARNLR